jgi:hypothetical protein
MKLRDSAALRPAVRTINAPADAVWEGLRDGWTYASWVVGSARIRDVDTDWPAANSRLHHSVGVWPLMLHDHTDVLACTPGEELVLAPRAWPWGRAALRLTIEERDGRSVVTMTEDITSGPARAVPRALRQLLVGPRNGECLRRLAFIAERRS